MTNWPARVRDALRMAHRRRVPTTALAVAVGFLSLHAAAQEGPLAPLGVRLGTSLSLDSNVFRVPDDAPDPQALRGISGKSDTFRTSVFGLDVDKTYSRQRLTASITKTDIRYDKFTSLDRDLLDYNGKLQWEVGPRVRGVLSASHAEDVVLFEDQTGVRFLNKRTTDNGDATIVVEVHPRWYLLGGVHESRTRTTQINVAQPSADVTTQELGLKYVSGSQNSVTLTRRSRQGEYIFPGGVAGGVATALIGTDFSDQETELLVTW